MHSDTASRSLALQPCNPRRRTLLPAPAPARALALAATLHPPRVEGECARLVTRTPSAGTQLVVVHLARPLVLGRSSAADYALESPLASCVHARISAVVSDTGHTLVSLADLSTNGTLVNGRRVHHHSVVLSDGDRFEIAGQLFRYVHTAPAPPALAPGPGPAAAVPQRVGDFLVYPRTLGSGAFSAVHLALDTRSLRQVACKKLARARVGKDRLEVIRREVAILRRANHPNINRIEHVEVDDVAVHIFLELVPGGDLFTYLLKHGRHDAPEAKWLLYQLLLALEYLHDTLGVAHRDVKLENVVLALTAAPGGRFPKAQLADFGQAKDAGARFKSLQGTLQYMAPEQLVAWTRHEGYDGKKADMWALGILLAHLLTGSHPFEPFPSTARPAEEAAAAKEDLGASVAHELAANPADETVVRGIVRGDIALPAGQWGSEDGAVRTLLGALLAPAPADRPTASASLASAWIAHSRTELDELWARVVPQPQPPTATHVARAKALEAHASSGHGPCLAPTAPAAPVSVEAVDGEAGDDVGARTGASAAPLDGAPPSSGSRSTSPACAATHTPSSSESASNARSLSSAALAALAESPARPRPLLPPKSAARQSRSSTHSSSGTRSRSSSASPPTEAHAERLAASMVEIEAGALPAPSLNTTTTITTTAPAPDASSSALDEPRPRLAPMSRTPTRSQASSRTSSGVYTPSTGALGGSSGFLSSSEDGGGGGGPGAGWLGTPATTAGYSSAAEGGSPLLAAPGGTGADGTPSKGPVQHAPVVATPPPFRGPGFPPPRRPLLEGLGIDFAVPSGTDTCSRQPRSNRRPSFDGEGEFARDLARLSAYAQSLPSPLPATPAAAAAIGEWSERGAGRPGPVPALDDPPAAAGAPSLPLTPLVLPVSAPAVGSRTRETSAASTWTTSSVASSSSRRPSFLHHPFSSPPPQPAWTSTPASMSMGDETDFFSTDADADDDDDEDDSFGFSTLRRGGGGAAYRAFGAFPLAGLAGAPVEGSRARAGPGPGGALRINSLWTEDAPAWAFGALGALDGYGYGYGDFDRDGDGERMQLAHGAPAEGVVDWSGRAIEKKELPAETTHLLLSRCRTPFQIAPLLTLAVPMLTRGLVVLDIRDCGLSEVPSAIASCCFLEELSISGNPLATGTLPSFLSTLPALHVLLADMCNLSSLPSSLAQLGRLHTLTLRNNRLRTLPAWLARLDALETLLVDGNPFHWQVQSIVQPLFAATSAAAVPGSEADAATPLSRTGAPPLPLATSPPFASPEPPYRSVSTTGTPIFNAFATPPLLAASSALAPLAPSPPELAAALESVRAADVRARDDAALPALGEAEAASGAATPALVAAADAGAASPPPESDFGAVGDKKEKQRGWGRLLKKVSGTRLRSGSKPPPPMPMPMPMPLPLLRPGALEPELRTYSQPVTRGEESEAESKSGGRGRMFGSVGRKMKKRSKDPSPAMPQKRRSFLLLDAFAPSPQSATARAFPAAPRDHSAALRSVLAYLRDLDDLSPSVSLPAIPLDAPSPPLRHSPSFGVLGSRPGSPAAVRRAESTRRLASTGSGSFRISQTDDEGPDTSPGAGDGSRAPTPTLLAAESEGKKSADDPAKRDAVLREIVETEQSYLRGLEELCGIYVASASVPVSSSANGGRRDTVLPTAERRVVFGNIEAIRDFHRKVLLPDLLAAVRGGGDSTVIAGKVGDVFVQHASFMKIYSSYINSFDDALARIQTWAKTTSRSRSNTASGAPVASPALGSSTMFDATASVASTLSSSQRKRIKSWLKRARAHPSHSQISLESYLLLPIQRIPRYRLLLETLLSCVPPPAVAPEPETLAALLDPHAQIAQAVAEMDDIAVTLNESKRENEGRAQLVMWQNRLVTRFKSPLVQPHRTLLRSGNLTLVRSVKRSMAPAEPPMPDLYRSTDSASPTESEEIPTLFQETKQIQLIGLLCTDLLVLVKAPPPPLDQDPAAPVELYTVLRLNSARPVLGSPAGRGDPPASLFGSDDMLRLRVGDKAICYLRIPGADAAKARKEALQWVNAINLQYEVNT
ncbi:hypothetical protein JCM3770_005725 [Rhodotorula araucariae]